MSFAQQPRTEKGQEEDRVRALSMPKLPAEYSWTRAVVYAMRRYLEAAVLEVRGKVTASDYLTIQTACRLEIAARAAVRAMRKHAKDLSLEQEQDLLRRFVSYSTQRDKLLQGLGLGSATGDGLDSLLYGPQAGEGVGDG